MSRACAPLAHLSCGDTKTQGAYDLPLPCAVGGIWHSRVSAVLIDVLRRALRAFYFEHQTRSPSSRALLLRAPAQPTGPLWAGFAQPRQSVLACANAFSCGGRGTVVGLVWRRRRAAQYLRARSTTFVLTTMPVGPSCSEPQCRKLPQQPQAAPGIRRRAQRLAADLGAVWRQGRRL